MTELYDAKNPWYYYGCFIQTGHYLFNEKMTIHYHESRARFNAYDGTLPVQNDRKPYVATFTRLPELNKTALAFWDYSVDSRPGSNSVVFAPGLDITPEDMLAQAEIRFPAVFGRLPQKVVYTKS
jgi:hypothetical protein